MSEVQHMERQIAALRSKYPVDPGIDKALTRKIRNRSSPRRPARSLDDVARQLQRFLADRLEGTFSIEGFSRLPGGGSKEQFIFQLTGVQAWEGKTLILRLQPEEALTETSRIAEFQLMRAMAAAVPVPAAPWLDEDGEVFDHPAMITEFVAGVTKPPVRQDGGVTGMGTTFTAAWRERLKVPYVDCLAKIHNFDWSGSDLSAFAPVGPRSTESVERLLNWQDRVGEEDHVTCYPVLKVAQRWLRDNMPVADKICVNHGDFRTGNFLFDGATGEITAVLDWELGRLGDYHDDLAYSTLRSGIGQLDVDGEFLVSGLIPRGEFLSLYEELSGNPVDLRKLHYYEVLHATRGALWFLSTGVGIVRNQKTHQDILAAWIVPMAYSFIATLCDLLKEEL